MDLFRDVHAANRRKAQPLASRMRPRTVEEFIGQEHFFGPDKLLRRILQADRLSSVIFYGPPGTGKTALAHVIANHTRCRFRQVNAVATGVKEVRELLAEARASLKTAAGAPSCSSTKSIASTGRSRMSSFRTWRKASSF